MLHPRLVPPPPHSAYPYPTLHPLTPPTPNPPPPTPPPPTLHHLFGNFWKRNRERRILFPSRGLETIKLISLGFVLH